MKSRLLSMLFTGMALACVLIIAVQLSQTSGNENTVKNPATSVTYEKLNQTVQPVLFKSISEQNGELRMSGVSEPNAVISIQNKRENYRQIKSSSSGNWTTALNVSASDTLAIGLLVFANQGAKIQSEETLYRIPSPSDQGEVRPSQGAALVMVTAPGGPTRIIQSPFRGLPTSGPLSMGPIDYDDRGSVIFSGISEAEGNVRIYANDLLIGQTPVAVNGRWFLMAGETLPLGSYEIKAELTDVGGVISDIVIPFKRLKSLKKSAGDLGRLSVSYEPYRWQVARDLRGGGRQYTAIFAPVTNVPETIEN